MVDQTAQFLCEWLRNRDVACPRCAYNLRNLTSDRCPECGERIELQVGLVEPKLAPYITLLVACSLGLGGSALFCALAYTAAPPSWWHEPAAIMLLVQLAITAIVLPLLLRLRRRLRRATLTVQWLAAATMCIVVLGLSLAIVLMFDTRP